MIFKSFFLPLRSSQGRCGELWFNSKLLNQGSIFKSTIRLFQSKKKIKKTTYFTEKIQPKNIGVSFENAHNQKMSMSKLWKPFFFTTSFSAGTFAACTIWQYENKRSESAFKKTNFWNFGGLNAKKHYSWREELNREWNKLSESEKLFLAVFAANVFVYLGWRVPKWNSFMMKYFTSNATSSHCWPLVLSTFSHYSGLHFIMNMFALYSFSFLAVSSLGKEQCTGLYLAGGAISSFISLFHKVVTRTATVSVGASGAIMAIIGYIAARYPDLQLTFIIPVFSLTASAALKTLILIDMTGVLLRWRIIDHACHLGGVFCGLFWFYWGNAHIWQKREPLLEWWHEIRAGVR